MRFSQCREGGRHRVKVRVGEPAPTIVKEAVERDAELIVLSWSGSSAEGRGAVVKALLDTAPCPLLIVPASATVIDLATPPRRRRQLSLRCGLAPAPAPGTSSDQ